MGLHPAVHPLFFLMKDLCKAQASISVPSTEMLVAVPFLQRLDVLKEQARDILVEEPAAVLA